MAKILGFSVIENVVPAATFVGANAEICCGDRVVPGDIFLTKRRNEIAACIKIDHADGDLLRLVNSSCLDMRCEVVNAGGIDAVTRVWLFRGGNAVWREPADPDMLNANVRAWRGHIQVASMLGNAIDLPVPVDIRPEGTGSSVIELRGDIGFGRNAATVVLGQIDAAVGTTIQLTIDSQGGLCNDAEAIYSALVRHPYAVHVTIERRAQSAAALIAMAGDTRTISSDGEMLLHASSLERVSGRNEAKDLRAIATQMERWDREAAGVFAARTGLDVETMASLIAQETSFTAGEAVRCGLVDAIDRYYIPASPANKMKARFAPINGPYQRVAARAREARTCQ